ncbi:MAG: hypothetical protein JST04_00240 [Bdellovibrionales bacterium]|nr:hypothetical protein [Bdellovibrionales bacterium]
MSKSSNRIFYPLAILASLLFVSVLAPSLPAAADSAAPDFVVESASSRAEVKIEYPRRSVEVRLLDRDRFGLPDAIQISLLDSLGNRVDLEMSALDSDSFSADLANERKYLGRIPAAYDSYVGVSLRIPFKRSP